MNNKAMVWVAAELTSFTSRLWAIDKSGKVQDRCVLPVLDKAGLGGAVAGFAGDNTCALVSCGLAQDGFRSVPATPLPDMLKARSLGDLALIGIPGLSQSAPAVATSGAELRIAGFLELNPEFDGVLCIVDHETIWAHISAKEVVSLQAFASCHLAETLCGSAEIAFEQEATEAYIESVSDTLSKPERLAGKLASARAESALQDLPNGVQRARVWGSLIGAELSAARPYWLGQQVAVIGNSDRANLYATAMRKQGLAPILADSEAMILKGFALAWARGKS